MSQIEDSPCLLNDSLYLVLAPPPKMPSQLATDLCSTKQINVGRYVPINLEIDELCKIKDRSHQFHLLSLKWLNPIIDCRGSIEGDRFFHENWNSIIYPFLQQLHSDSHAHIFMASNDHALALRTLVLCKIYVLGNQLLRAQLTPILLHCIELLLDEKNYDEYSNHGWDQSRSLLIAQKMMLQSTKIAEKRFENELNHAFTEEGVHVENSPHYHFHMLNNLIYSMSLFQDVNVGKRLLKSMEEIAKLAIKYQQAILRNDNSIPNIGDSYYSPPKFNPLTTEFIKRNIGPDYSDGFFPFPKSGYCVWKSNIGDKEVHLTIKNGNLSRYHRHDDDLSITMNVDGEEIFIDGGLYKYEEKDPNRLFMRSPNSHSTIILPNKEPSRSVFKSSSNSAYVEEKKFIAHAKMWLNETVVREIRKINDNEFEFIDSVTNHIGKYNILFQTCQDVIIDGRTKFALSFGFGYVSVDLSDPNNQVSKIECLPSKYSPTHGELKDSTTIVLHSNSPTLKYRICIEIS